jgi:hypothetical protein
VAIFATDDDVTSKDKKVARASATVEGRRIMIEQFDVNVEAGWVHDKAAVEAQVVAALAAFTLSQVRRPGITQRAGMGGRTQIESRTEERAGVAD